jgi:hypothetical protein
MIAQIFETNSSDSAHSNICGRLPMNERRTYARQKVFKAGTIEFNRAGAINCTVRNVSVAGACLELESPVGIPETFDLMIRVDRALHHCRVVWRSAGRIGVSFN